MPERNAHEKKIAGAASVVGSATVLSRVLGYTRDAVIAYIFGAGMQADAFFAAFRIANLLRRLVGEGALTSSFIPIFTEELSLRSRAGIQALASRAFTLFFFILFGLTVLGILFSREIVWLMSPGFMEDPEKFELTVKLTKLLFPYMIFIGLMAMAMGVLNSLRHFAAPALAPVFLNLAMIASVLLFMDFFYEPIYSLAIGVLVGGMLQFAIQVPFLNKYGFPLKPVFGFFDDPAIKKIFVLMGPALIGVGVYQLNNLVNLWFASHLPEGSVSYLYYAGRLMELPLGVFGVAVSTAVLPSLSEHSAARDWNNFKGSLAYAIRLVNFVTIPATIGLLLLSYPIIDILFRRGEFGYDAAVNTASALSFYAIGLVAISSTRILASVFFSLKDTRTPMYAAIASFIVNVIFSFILIGPMQHNGLALATSIAAIANSAILIIVLKKKLGRMDGKEMLGSAIKTSIASLAMGVVVYFMIGFSDYASMGVLMKTAVVLASVVIGSIVFFIASEVLGIREIAFFKGIFMKRR